MSQDFNICYLCVIFWDLQFKGKGRVLDIAPHDETSMEALRYGTRCQGITQFYLPPTR